jgi:protein-S-isoprenylcysteine O-methyltransferase Ste14
MCNEDAKWCANVALGCAFVMLLGGVILSAYVEEGRDYMLVMFAVISLLFAGVGGWMHYRTWRDKKRRTIIRTGWRRR